MRQASKKEHHIALKTREMKMSRSIATHRTNIFSIV